jgi:hypothetical protein
MNIILYIYVCVYLCVCTSARKPPSPALWWGYVGVCVGMWGYVVGMWYCWLDLMDSFNPEHLSFTTLCCPQFPLKWEGTNANNKRLVTKDFVCLSAALSGDFICSELGLAFATKSHW